MNEIKQKRIKPKIDKGDMIFYCVFLAWPVLQFCIYYIGVNFNSILMSFKWFDTDTREMSYSFKQYGEIFKWMGTDEFKSLLTVSLKSFLITTVISVPLGLLFAYYIFKKLPGWGAFRVILFLPKIISGVVIALIFRWFLEEYVPFILPSVGNLLDTGGKLEKNIFPVLMFYNIWVGFGTTVLMYSNKMSSISDEIIESAHLDGATGFKEFWYIVLPLTYSTLSVFLITGVATVFVGQFGAYEFYPFGTPAEIKSIGYYFFVNVKGAFANIVDPQNTAAIYKYAALGIILTFITIPVAFTVRWALEKFGPSED